MDSLIKKLVEIEEKFENLSKQLGDPEIAQDHKKYEKIAKARAAIEELVELFREYKKDIQNLEDARKMVESETDPEIKEMYEEEITSIEEKIPEYEKKMKLLLIPKDPYDEKNIIVEIRAGTGGGEAALFAQELYRMYSRYAESKKWKVEVMDTNYTGLGGIKEIVFAIKGKDVYSRLKYESGVHRVQRVPATESSGRLHTSAATVAVMPEADDVEVVINQEDLRIDTFCASGHGGQCVNTTYSAIRITHLPTNTVVQCQDEKSQLKNKEKAMKVLKSRLLRLKQKEQEDEISGNRKSQVKSGDRSEKFRTYNFPQNRVTTHTIGLTLYNLDAIMEGDLDPIIDQMIALDQAERLKNLE